MSTCLPLRLISPFPTRVNITHATRFQSPIFRPTLFSGLPNSTNLLRSPLTLVKSGFLEPGHLPDPEKSEGLISELFGRAEGVIYVIADAAVSNTEAVNGGGVIKQNNDWFSGITSYMETVLKILKDGLSGLHVPYAYGFAIILLTLLVKAATFPLSKKQRLTPEESKLDEAIYQSKGILPTFVFPAILYTTQRLNMHFSNIHGEESSLQGITLLPIDIHQQC